MRGEAENWGREGGDGGGGCMSWRDGVESERDGVRFEVVGGGWDDR